MLSHQNLPRLSTDPVSRYAPSQRIEILHEIAESRIRRRVVTVHAALAPFYPDEVISFAHLLDIFRSVADFNRRVHFQICHPATFRCHLFVRFRDTQSTSTPQLPPLHPSPLGVPWRSFFFFFFFGRRGNTLRTTSRTPSCPGECGTPRRDGRGESTH
jgi:hypothetical protein